MPKLTISYDGVTLDALREWRRRRPELHIRLDGDEEALRRAMKLAGVKRYEITHYSPQGWADAASDADARVRLTE